MITRYRRHESAQDDREIQFKNDKEAGQPIVLETLDAAIAENAGCPSLKGSHLAM